MNRKYTLYGLLAAASLFSSCSRIDNGLDTDDIAYMTLNITANPVAEGIERTEGLKIVLENFAEGYRIEQEMTDGVNRIEKLIPGTYSINITGNVEQEGKTFYLIGSKVNYLVVKDGESLSIDVNGASVGPLAFSELFYAGTEPFYFRNQFYEIINNSDETVYLDGLHFANLVPSAATVNLPVWPESDAGKYVYAERIWKIPGTGKDYPLAPGESFSMAQFAANHQLAQYNPKSPIDCSTSEFEFNMNNANFPDQPATDMQHVFYNGLAGKGSLPQYLTSVMGGAYVIFRVPEGESYDPVNNKSLQTRNLATTSANLYAKIPLTYIMDAVECGQNENMITAKRVPSLLDAGMTYVGATYNSKGVRRKKSGVDNAGRPILQDTNNSTEDFERLVTPEFRHYGEGIPSWSTAK
ncbi:DUF4876 domain-containing protein [Sphingobacterium hotanense]|uniref:DUF4876 domain-containing protein n=1 Tax=Sphingobacterium hotanense TaxID=649196 RepID=A0ABT7NRD0_9SPHI|nr:DUF4876 domain-containing protein [Sphingobacterium hotanense]MDM1049811.1 DUF4876 domain-containing protein [Sphingobacterium hotanense]